MKEDVAETIREIHKLNPADGDVIAVKVPSHWDRTEMWDVINGIKDQGIKIVAFTDDVELEVIKDDHQYVLMVPHHLSETQQQRIKDEWVESFPKAPLKIYSGEGTLVDEGPVNGSEPAPGMDTL